MGEDDGCIRIMISMLNVLKILFFSLGLLRLVKTLGQLQLREYGCVMYDTHNIFNPTIPEN
jgi:hypothetical protein